MGKYTQASSDKYNKLRTQGKIAEGVSYRQWVANEANAIQKEYDDRKKAGKMTPGVTFEMFKASYTAPKPTSKTYVTPPSELKPKPKTKKKGDIKVSKAKAKRLGIPDSERKSLTREQLTEYETGSGQYEVRNDKTFLKRDEEKEIAPITQPAITEPALQPQAPIQLQKPINLNKEKTGIAAYMEKETIGAKVARIITSPKTTLVLTGVLATMLGVAAGSALAARAAATTGSGGTATITRTKTLLQNVVQKAGTKKMITPISREGHRLNPKTGDMIPFKEVGKQTFTRMIAEKIIAKAGTSITTQRSFIGKAANTGVDKLFAAGGLAAKNAPIAARYTTNPKTMSLTKKILITAGVSLAAASIAKDIIGTYPFASFIGKEEATQAIGLPMWQALEAGDLEGMEALLNASNELVNAEMTIKDKIPYINVQKAVGDNIEAVRKANIQWKRLLDHLRGELEFEGQSEGEAIAQRDIEQKEYYEGTTAEGIEREGEKREYYEDRSQKEAKKREMEMDIWRLRREKKYDEADELERQLIEMLKSGEL